MDYFRNFYGNPGQFTNWQQYAGFDPNKSLISSSMGAAGQQAESTAGAVPPPSSFAEAGEQMFNKFKTNISNIGTNISNAADQFSQGNIYSGLRAAQGSPIAPPGAPKPPAAPGVVQQPMVDDYDYPSRVGQ